MHIRRLIFTGFILSCQGFLIPRMSLQEFNNFKEIYNKNYLTNSFSLIRANDLVWSYFVNNYLLGKSPAAFDILYWNSDSTNLPAKMYIYYLKNMYIECSFNEGFT